MNKDVREKEYILIVEDDNDINQLLATYFKAEGFNVAQAYSGTEARYYLEQEPQLIILDLMLPGISGIDFLKILRENSKVPVIIISGKIEVDDKVQLLELGADDYITKPFEKKEVLARAKAALRRAKWPTETENNEVIELNYQDLQLNLQQHVVLWQQKPIECTQIEFALLKNFLAEPKKVFSKDALYRLVWKDDYFADDNVIAVHISHLRQKLKKASGKDLIVTVWGIGYRLAE